MAESQRPDFTAIRRAHGHSPFALTPVINKIMRTRRCRPRTIFLVEDLQRVPSTKSEHWGLIRLMLGDGEMCVQALLSGPMHQFVDNGEITPGCYVRVDRFKLEGRRIQGDKPDEPAIMVYLVVEDLITIGWNDAYRAMWDEQVGNVEPAENAPSKMADRTYLSVPQSEPRRRKAKIGAPANKDAAVGDASESLDRQTPYPFKASQKEPETKRKMKKKKTVTFNSQPTAPGNEPVALPRDWTDPQTPLKLTTLRAIPNLPYRQNWSCNVLAIVASLSPVEASYLPPFQQRTARIADPSTAKQVHLTVFLDPDEFEPKVGSAVLLVGVKNHMFDGGSLKKYASDKERDGGMQWWFEDPHQFKWCDVEAIKNWWTEVGKSQT